MPRYDSDKERRDALKPIREKIGDDLCDARDEGRPVDPEPFVFPPVEDGHPDELTDEVTWEQLDKGVCPKGDKHVVHLGMLAGTIAHAWCSKCGQYTNKALPQEVYDSW